MSLLNQSYIPESAHRMAEVEELPVKDAAESGSESDDADSIPELEEWNFWMKKLSCPLDGWAAITTLFILHNNFHPSQSYYHLSCV